MIDLVVGLSLEEMHSEECTFAVQRCAIFEWTPSGHHFKANSFTRNFNIYCKNGSRIISVKTKTNYSLKLKQIHIFKLLLKLLLKWDSWCIRPQLEEIQSAYSALLSFFFSSLQHKIFSDFKLVNMNIVQVMFCLPCLIF